MDFASLQHIKDRRSTGRGLCLPATFRPQGLVTLSTAYSLRSRAGLISCQRRSWDSPFGAFSSGKVSERFRPEAPTYRFSHRSFPPPKRRAGPDGPRFLGFDPCRSPSRPGMCLARRPPDAPVGFTLSGPSSERLGPDFAEPPLTRLAAETTHASTAGASEFQSTLVWSHPIAVQARRLDGTTHLGFSHRLRSTAVQARPRPGYGFTSRRVTRSRRLPDALWTGRPALPEPAGTSLGAEPSRRFRR
jgi:hypothetical protein